MSESPTIKQDEDLPTGNSNNEKGASVLKEGVRFMKRPREVPEQSSATLDDCEPEEKRPTFRLNPPTLIHGQAKSVPKEESVSTDATPKRNFLRPSILNPPTTVTAASSVLNSPVNGQAVLTSSKPSLLGSGMLLSGQVPLSNPFLRATSSDDEDSGKDPKQEFLFQSMIEQRTNIKENGAKPESNGNQASITPSSAPEAAAKKEDFVFGRKMEERVLQSEADNTSDEIGQAADTKEEGSSFVFGKNLSDRIKVSGSESASSVLFSTAPAESSIFTESTMNPVETHLKTNSACNRKLEEDAAVCFAATNTKPVMPEIDIKTGEEDEKNVLQIQCKLFQYNPTSQNWMERGRGNLRLNDKRMSASDQVFQSRLVMRTHGSLRLVLNTKIWAHMIIDRASSKSVRISAQNENGDIGVYLIMATINDAEQIYRALEYRVLHLKQLEDKVKRTESPIPDAGNADVGKSASLPVSEDSTQQDVESPLAISPSDKDSNFHGYEQHDVQSRSSGVKNDTDQSTESEATNEQAEAAKTMHVSASSGDISKDESFTQEQLKETEKSEGILKEETKLDTNN